MSSLTAPWDRTEDNEKYVPKQVTLTEEEVKEAFATNYNNAFIKKFTQVDKFYADPVFNSQTYCLHSFVPTKGARPDEHGVYGFIKFRGSFTTQKEADERAEYLIRNVDSFHDIYTSYCGRPFPLSSNSRFVNETNEIDMKSHIKKATSEEIKAKVTKDREISDSIKNKQDKLLEESSKAEQGLPTETPDDRYTTLQVKRANLVHVYIETQKNLEKIKNSILKAREEISILESTNPECKDVYVDKYNHARSESGLDARLDNTYLKYMGLDDVEILGF